MSTSRDKNTCMGADFSEVWERLLRETEIRFLKDLGKLVGVTQQNVSIRKQENLFPFGWAYPVAVKYNLLTEWILTGKGPKRIDDLKTSQDYEFPILNDLDEWLKEVVKYEPYRREWFKASIEDSFPKFKDWLKRKDEEDNRYQNIPDSKVA